MRPILIRCLDDSSISAERRSGVIESINIDPHLNESDISILPMSRLNMTIIFMVVNFLSSHLAIAEPLYMRKNIKIQINTI